MNDPALKIDRDQKLVTWYVQRSKPFQRFQVPWGELWVGEPLEAGTEIWVAADAAFDLMVEGDAVRLFEAITPGRHRFLLTVLDSTDVSKSNA